MVVFDFQQGRQIFFVIFGIYELLYQAGDFIINGLVFLLEKLAFFLLMMAENILSEQG